VRSRCTFIEETPLRLVEQEVKGHNHLRRGSFDDSMTAPVRTVKHPRNARTVRKCG